MVAEESDSGFPDSLEIVHENGGGFLSLFSVLFSEGFYSFFDLFYLGLIFDLRQIESFDIIQEMFHIRVCTLRIVLMGQCSLLKIYVYTLLIIFTWSHLHARAF